MHLAKISLAVMCFAILNGCESFPLLSDENSKQQQAIKAAQDEAAKKIKLDLAVRQSMQELYDKNPEILKAHIEKLEQAAAQGNVNAQFALGQMYENGKRVQQNYKEALHWYKLAAAQGDTRARYRIGVMYENGNGVTRDLKEATKWFKLASTPTNSKSESYGEKIRACVQPGVSFPVPPRKDTNPSVEYRISLRDDGNIVSVLLIKNSGNANFDRAVETAIRRCSPFPAPPSGKYPGYINVKYNMYN